MNHSIREARAGIDYRSSFLHHTQQGSTGLRNLKAITLLLLIAASLVFMQFNPLPNGISFSRRMQALNKLKNRTLLPQESDYGDRATLNALLQPGHDSTRWSD